MLCFVFGNGQSATEYQSSATEYFDMQIAWLTKLSAVALMRELTADLLPSKMALLILNLCEGASVVSRAINKPELFNDTLEQILMIVKRK
jgi:TetR/AcrR family transcriptional repressor of nem operon